jgi:Protein of unknown function (DUF4058)
MPSPPLGMDPSIASPELWSDFHNNLAAEIRANLKMCVGSAFVRLCHQSLCPDA